jgi:hypothetical protein
VPGARYVLGVDTGKGTGRDYSVIQVLRMVSAEMIVQVALYRNNTIRPHDYAQVVVSVAQFYNNAHLMIENNDIGQAVCDTIWYELEYENLVNADDKGLGIRSTKSSKKYANMLLKEYLEKGWLRICDDRTIYELSRYEEVRPNVFAAHQHENDDCTTALLWSLYFIRTDDYEGERQNISRVSEDYSITNGSWDENSIEIGGDRSTSGGDPNWQPSAFFD